MGTYLCYDLKGIQQYIFQVPKLKCCIGGSRQIDDFDHEDAKSIAEELKEYGVERLYSGGGKGAFVCKDETKLDELKNRLIHCAGDYGLTIRFGVNEDYSIAASEITDTYCYQPDSLEGQPCSLSGMYPTTDPEGIHQKFKSRIQRASEHGQESETEKIFLDAIRDKVPAAKEAEFFYDVNANNKRGWGDGEAGAAALGNRNRWAVVCMDGNDMGEQFRKFKETGPGNEEWKDWLGEMSKGLASCTEGAVKAAMVEVVKEYVRNEKTVFISVLPIRPLIVGGDDVTILIHCSYADLFVETMIDEFNKLSKDDNVRHLWYGTGWELTISAGILYAPVTLPLNEAIEYAESLLASAKSKGRDMKEAGCASPPCVDWESVTEGLLTAPHIRRREFRFHDEEIKRDVSLTMRPYTLKDFKELRTKVDKYCLFAPSSNEGEEDKSYAVPWSIRHEIMTSLHASKTDRLAFYAKLAKNWPDLAAVLKEPWKKEQVDDKNKYGDAWDASKPDELKTDFIDLILLAEEEKRMDNGKKQNQEED